MSVLWFAIVLTYDSMVSLGINNAGNFTRLRLVKLILALLVLLFPYSTADHAIRYTHILEKWFPFVRERASSFLNLCKNKLRANINRYKVKCKCCSAFIRKRIWFLSVCRNNSLFICHKCSYQSLSNRSLCS